MSISLTPASPRPRGHQEVMHPPPEAAGKVLTIENVTMGTIDKNMSFSIYAGEVVGIGGLIGSGRTEIAKIIYRAFKRNLIDGSTVRLHGKPIRYKVPKQAINDGIAYIADDRKLNGFFEIMLLMTKSTSASLTTRSRPRVMKDLDLREPAPETPRRIYRASSSTVSSASS